MEMLRGSKVYITHDILYTTCVYVMTSVMANIVNVFSLAIVNNSR